jgi:hypothetical protein
LDTKQIGFFGDSWVVGAELPDRNLSFPNLLDAKNYGQGGTSIPGLLRRFNEVEKNFSTAIFCLTDPARLMFYKSWDQYKDDMQGTALTTREYEMLRKISNDYNNDIIVSQVCYILYKWCLDLNITCYFVNLFGGQLGKSFLYNLIPDNVWLLPIHTCLTKEVFDKNGWFPDYPTIGDYTYWLQNNNEDVQTCIRPCDAHPNKLGHKAIADFIGSKINV